MSGCSTSGTGHELSRLGHYEIRTLLVDGFLDALRLGQHAYLSESLDFPCVFFLLGAGILHSMEKATQFVHGTPKLAASQRTCASSFQQSLRIAVMADNVPFASGRSVVTANDQPTTEVPRFNAEE